MYSSTPSKTGDPHSPTQSLEQSRFSLPRSGSIAENGVRGHDARHRCKSGIAVRTRSIHSGNAQHAMVQYPKVRFLSTAADCETNSLRPLFRSASSVDTDSGKKGGGRAESSGDRTGPKQHALRSPRSECALCALPHSRSRAHESDFLSPESSRSSGPKQRRR